MKRLVIISCSLILLGIGGFFLADHFLGNQALSHDEKEKALENLLGRPAQLNDKGAIIWKTYTGKYFSIDYPVDANISPRSSSSAFLDSFSYSLVGDHILVTVTIKNAQGDLRSDSSVVARISQPDTYAATESGKPSCLAFAKTGEESERSLFCLVGGRIGSYVVSGPNSEKVSSYYSDILRTLSW